MKAAVLSRLGSRDLNLLKVFVAVVRSGGFTAARSELNVSQPTISIKIAELEGRLGMRLCERGRGGFRLSTEGQRVHDAAGALFQSMETFQAAIGAMQGRLVGDLHIGVADATVTNRDLRIDASIARLKRDVPDVHLHLHVESARELELGLVENRFHAVIGPLQRRRPELVYAPILVERQVLYCGRRHPLFERAPDAINVTELGAVDFVRRGYLAQWEPPLGVRFHATATTFHMEATTRLILSGTHVGYLPSHHAELWVQQGDLRPVLPGFLSYGSPFLLAARRSNRGPILTRFLKSFQAIQKHRALE